MRPGKYGLALATALSVFALTACGGATVENDPGTDTSVAPLERAPQSTPTASDDTEDAEDTEGTGGGEDGDPPAAPPAPDSPQPRDQGAQEVPEVPDPQAERSEEDTTFLGGMSDGGIEVEGVEDQLIGAASTVCRSDAEEGGVADVTVNAVAGQLVEQGRTDLDAEEVGALIENEARAAYC